MKKFIIKVDYDTYLAIAPDRIVDNIQKHQKSFLKWLYDKNNNHKLWIIENGKKYGVMYDAKDFIEYLNNYIIQNKENAIILEKDYIEQREGFPIIFF